MIRISALTYPGKSPWIIHILLLSLALHLFVISFPSDGGKVFDEVSYVQASLDFMAGKASNLEHSFLGKAWAGFSIAVFGNSWFAWRIPSVLFGLFSIFVFYCLARIFLNEYEALCASAFLSFENVFFTHSSLLMLDVPPLFFGILGIFLYCKGRYWSSAAVLSLSFLCKEWGIMFAAIVAVDSIMQNGRNLTAKSLRRGVIFLLIYLGGIFLAMWAYDLIYKPVGQMQVAQDTVNVYENGNVAKKERQGTENLPIRNPVDHLRYMRNYHSSLVMKDHEWIDAWNNVPWGWISPFYVKAPIYFQTTLTRNITLSSSDQKVESVTKITHPITWTGMGNLCIWLSIWLVAPFCVFRILTRRSVHLDYLILFWIIFTYLPWFYVSLVMKRIVYSYYFINTVPALCLGIPHLIACLAPSDKTKKAVLAIWLAATIGFFFYFFPVNVFAE